MKIINKIVLKFMLKKITKYLEKGIEYIVWMGEYDKSEKFRNDIEVTKKTVTDMLNYL